MFRLKSPQEQLDFESYVEAIFRIGDVEKIQDELNGLNVPPPYRLRIKVLYSNTSVKDILDGLVEKRKLQNFDLESKTYLLNSELWQEDSKKIKIPFFLASFDQYGRSNNTQAIISVCKTYQWNFLRQFSKKIYPQLVPILLSQSEMIKCAKNLKQFTGHNVNVKSLSAKEAFRGKKGNHLKSLRVWTDEELDKALIGIQDRHQIIISLDVEFFQKIGDQVNVLPKAICKIRKNGEIEVTGSYKIAFDAVAAQIAEVGEKKLKFLSGRGLRASNYEPKPVAVNFVQPVFEKLDAVRNFVHILSKYPHSMHAVEHGNPYAHVQITDILDGSSFDIWAISPSRIALMPGLKASEAAFERVVHYIFDKFKEGHIADYGHEGRSI
jgi:hypothetical protein